MLIHIFRADGRVFGFTPQADGSNLPTRHGAWTAFKSVDMTKGVAMPGVNVDECLDDIEKLGMHITDAHTRITDQAV